MFTSVMKAVAVLAFAACGVIAALPPLVLQQLPAFGVSQCEQITLAWSGGAPPFNVFLRQNKTGLVIKAFPLQTVPTFVWKVDLPEGTKFVLQVLSSPDVDHTVPTATSDPYTILGSSDSSCINTSLVDAPYGTPKAPISSPSLTTVHAPSATGAHHAESKSKANHTVPIVVGVLGGVIGLAAIVFGIMFFVRRKNQAAMAKARKSFVGKPTWVDDVDLEIPKPAPTHF